MLEQETMQALLAVTMALEVISRFKGGWALNNLMLDLGVSQAERSGLAKHLVALRKYDALMRDVMMGPKHEQHELEFKNGVHAFYARLLEALPPTMSVAN